MGVVPVIKNEHLRTTVIKGLKRHLGIPVIKANQNTEPPEYPYLTYNITTLESANAGTWGEYSDGIDRIPVTQTWSISLLSDKELESVELAIKARDFLQHSGTSYLNDNDVIVEGATSITSRDSFISIEYEYKNGFDVTFWMLAEETNPIEDIGTIVKVRLKEV